MPPVSSQASYSANAGHPQKGRRRSTGIVVPHAPRWYQRAGAWAVVALVRTVSATLRYEWVDPARTFEPPAIGQAIFCVWHNRLALTMKAYFGYARNHRPSPGMAGLVSASRDGGFLAAILEAFGVQPVRGSTSRRGPQALLELTGWAEKGYDLAITPDGPRGPRYVVQDGVMSLAQVTGLPIVPFSFQCAWKIRARSWDRFQVPLPFSKCRMVVGAPLRVPRDLSQAQRETLRRQLEETLKSISGSDD
jgi:hypothetical protein